jgi:hypothetical protein
LGGQESLLEHSTQGRSPPAESDIGCQGQKEGQRWGDINIDLEQVEIEEARQPKLSMSVTRSGSGWGWTKSLLRLALAARHAC